MSQPSRIAHFPISAFAVVMGLSGLTLAWERAEAIFALSNLPSALLLGLTAAVFAALLVAYATKIARFPAAVLKELRHPIKLSFFPAVSISLILIATATLHRAPAVSEVVWLVGTLAHLLFTLYVLSAWIHHEHFQIQHINPAWFIPVVGNILVPIAGVAHGYVEISWFFFSIGLVFWLVLMTIIFYRVIFHQPLPQKLLPTFFILIAPPAVGFISYLKLAGGLDNFGRVLYYFGLFITLLLFTQVTRFRRLKFFLSWWAYSFPIAAITIATLAIQERIGERFLTLGAAMLALLTGLILLLLVRTAIAVARREICVEEE